MTAATGSSRLVGLTLLLGAVLGCAPGTSPVAEPRAPRPDATVNAPAAPPPRAPLTAREQKLVEELRADVTWLATGVGERNLEHEMQLATATDELVFKLEAAGHAVERLGVVSGEDVTQNLELVIRGSKLGAEQVIVGAHYDTHVGSPGADDDATGVAAILALARAFRGLTPIRTLRLALFSNGELPHFQTPSMGSLAYAKRLRGERANVVAMLSLEGLGYFDDAVGSQRYPASVASRFPRTGDFLAVVGSDRQPEVLERIAATLQPIATLPVVAQALPHDTPEAAGSDHWAFWQLDFPAVMITDTAAFRNPHHHRASDLPETLDFERFARSVAAIEAAVRHLVGEDSAKESARSDSSGAQRAHEGTAGVGSGDP